jgi:hypothetical protein
VSSKVPGEPGGFGAEAKVIENGEIVPVTVDGRPRAGTSKTPPRVGSPAAYKPPRSKGKKPTV